MDNKNQDFYEFKTTSTLDVETIIEIADRTDNIILNHLKTDGNYHHWRMMKSYNLTSDNFQRLVYFLIEIGRREQQEIYNRSELLHDNQPNRSILITLKDKGIQFQNKGLASHEVLGAIEILRVRTVSQQIIFDDKINKKIKSENNDSNQPT